RIAHRLPGRNRRPRPPARQTGAGRRPGAGRHGHDRLGGLPPVRPDGPGALAPVLFMGESAFGSRRWITIAGTQIQASEVAKLLTIVALARYLADRQLQITRVRTLLTSLALADLPAALVMAGNEMW